nr:hypothetical protein [Heyndrickxia oleronia]
MQFEFHMQVRDLLINQSNEKVTMHYMDHSWLLPMIGNRPPYYTNPRYEPYYTII